jgi:membrane protein DedA with SNARE-associated domain
MRIQNRLSAAALAAMLGATGSGWANTEGTTSQEQISEARMATFRPMNDTEQQSIGCIASAAATMAATYAVGPSEIIMLVVGGVIIPSSSSVLFASLMATMASLGCVGGATITPLVTRAWKEFNAREQSAFTSAADTGAPPIVEVQTIAGDQVQEGEPDYVFEQGMGCIVAGGTSALAASAIGASETLMITAGGLLAPSTSPTLWLGIFSTLVAGTCSLGAVATPGLLWAYEQKRNIGASLSQAAGFASGATTAVHPIGATFTPIERGTLVPMPPAASLVGGVR